ncbi:MAG: hypothetical protein AAF354_13065 [Pseudomonadota bacterium]
MVEFVFADSDTLVQTLQTKDPALEVKARDIAMRLGLAFELRLVGYGDLETAVQSV